MEGTFFGHKLTYAEPEFGQDEGLWSQNGDTPCQGITTSCKARNCGHIDGDISLFQSVCLRQFRPPLFGFLCIASGVVESDQALHNI
jgi:hypothetical protein